MTTRSTRLLALILVSLAACGDDGNPGTDTECGDGVREGAEQCDDGNTNNGDGCSGSCTSELTMLCGNGAVEGTEACDDGNTNNGDGCSSTCTSETSTCGDGNITTGEQCDDSNTTNGDGCSSTCQTEIVNPTCGNGVVGAGETCDDGGTASGNGCSSTCQTEPGFTCTGAPSVCTAVTPAGTCAAPFVINMTGTTTLTGTATGDTTASTNQVAAANCSGGAPTTGSGKDHVYRFTTTDVRDIAIEVSDTSSFDTVVRVLSSPCDPSMDLDEYTGADGCDDEDPSGELLEYVALPAGTYYVVIDGFATADAGTYSFTVTARPTLCGNGALDPISHVTPPIEEECDDTDLTSGDGCSSRCEVEPGFSCNAAEPSVCTALCGNGTLDSGETCDDGGTVAGNGCGATCQIESGFTCTGTPSVCTAIVCGNSIVQTGEMCDDGNIVPTDGCNATCQITAGWSCTTAPPAASVCAMTCGNGTLQAGEECEDSNILDGDRCSSTCTLEFDTAESAEPNNTTPVALTAGNHILRGELTAGDYNLYTFTLSAAATVHIETYDRMDPNLNNHSGVIGTQVPMVDCFDIDTVVRLFDSAGNPATNAGALFTDDDDGDLDCSYLGPNDGNDSPGVNPSEGVLVPGTYTIKVNLFDNTDTTTRYLIDLQIIGTSAAAPVIGDLVLNEYMAADSTTADTNCDTVTTGTDDEFIELVNSSSTKVLNLGGVQVHDLQVGLRHTFSAGTVLAPGKAIVVWSGGAPACAGVNFYSLASTGVLGLNDSGGDSIIVKAAGGATDLLTHPYTVTTAGTSDNRSPDITGTFALHTAVAGAVGLFSPGKRANNTAF